MDKPLYTRPHLYKSPKGDQLCNRSFDDLADLDLLGKLFPGIRLAGLEAERYPLPLVVDLKDLDLMLISLRCSLLC